MKNKGFCKTNLGVHQAANVFSVKWRSAARFGYILNPFSHFVFAQTVIGQLSSAKYRFFRCDACRSGVDFIYTT